MRVDIIVGIVVIWGLFIVTGCSTAAAQEFEFAPQLSSSEQLRIPVHGFIPPSLDLSHVTAAELPDWMSPLDPPARLDWRESGRVTSVKNQGACGSCYSFASLGNVESRILMTGGGTYDLSENNAKECNWYETSCDGGNYFQMANLFSKKGTVLESCDPYVAGDVACDSSCPYIKALLDWRVISSGSVPSTALLKGYIQLFGPVYTTLYAGSTAEPAWYSEFGSYDGSYTLYHTTGQQTNHAVLIVGWDDDLTHAGGTGAWIVKNSWGTSWGGTCGYGVEGGYFTIAYGSANIGTYSSYASDLHDVTSGEVVMYYDEGGFTSAMGCGTTTAWGLCKFVPASDIYVNRVEFWTYDATTDIDVYVYDDFNGSSLSNLLASQLNANYDELGYHSVALTSPPQIAGGNDIYVAVRFTNAVSTHPVVVDNESPIQTATTWISCTGTAGSWIDVGSGYGVDVGIRVRTSPTSTPSDEEPPQLSSVASTGGYAVDVEFNEELDPTTATNINNYEITYWSYELFVTGAALDGSGKIVILTTSNSQIDESYFSGQPVSYTLKVMNVEDTAGNAISASGITDTFTGTNPVGVANWGSVDNQIISGKVYNGGGDTLPGITIFFGNNGFNGAQGMAALANDDVEVKVVSDSLGQYQFAGLPLIESTVAGELHVLGASAYEAYDLDTNFGTSPISRDIVLYQIITNTRIDGYIKDSRGDTLAGGVDPQLELIRGDLISIIPWDDHSSPTGSCYYNSALGYYHIKDVLAGGTYTLRGDFGAGYTDHCSTFVVTPGQTTTHNITVFKLTANSLLSIYQTSPAAGYISSSPLTFQWEDTDHPDIQSYVVGIWSEAAAPVAGRQSLAQPTPDVFYYIVPESVTTVTIDPDSTPMVIVGEQYRVITNEQLTAGATYYWGIYAFATPYNEVDTAAQYSGEPADGLWSFCHKLTATPTFSPPPGTYGYNVTISMLCSTPEVVIYYTLNGSTPTDSSTQYTDPVTLSGTVTNVKARAYRNGWSASAVAAGTYVTTIAAVDEEEEPTAPVSFSLAQNYPNPFNPTTVIEYYLRHGAPVELAVYNLLGERVKTIISEAQPAGWHTATWDGNDNLGSPVASGVYLYQLKAGDYIESRKMLLLR